MRVESCASAVPATESAIMGKNYSLPEMQQVKNSTANLYVIHAKVVADIDLVEWYSRGHLRRYRATREAIESEALDYVVVLYGGCEQLATDRPLIFDTNARKPCRDTIAIINDREARETDARLILDFPMVSYLSDQEEIEDIRNADKRLQATCETHAPEA
jgi:hypothetical protein